MSKTPSINYMPIMSCCLRTDKAANNVMVVCKKCYIDTLVIELGINNVNSNNPTYIPIDDSSETIREESQPFRHISRIGNV